MSTARMVTCRLRQYLLCCHELCCGCGKGRNSVQTFSASDASRHLTHLFVYPVTKCRLQSRRANRETRLCSILASFARGNCGTPRYHLSPRKTNFCPTGPAPVAFYFCQDRRRYIRTPSLCTSRSYRVLVVKSRILWLPLGVWY